MLAIVIPYYKIDYFKQTLDSLAKQTDQRFNVYIGDDASPDDSSNIINEFKPAISIAYKRFDNNIGRNDLVGHWERCIEMINRGEEWVMILGDDDILSPNVVEEFYASIDEVNKCKAQVIKLNTVVIDNTGQEISRKRPTPKILNGIDNLLDKFQLQNRGSLTEHIFHLQSLLKKRFTKYPLAWHTDDKIVLDLSLYNPIYFIDKAFGYIRVSDSSISGQTNNLLLKYKATELFFNDILYLKNHFSQSQLKRLLDIIEWQETSKKIKIIKKDRLKLVKDAYGILYLLKSIILKNIK